MQSDDDPARGERRRSQPKIQRLGHRKDLGRSQLATNSFSLFLVPLLCLCVTTLLLWRAEMRDEVRCCLQHGRGKEMRNTCCWQVLLNLIPGLIPGNHINGESDAPLKEKDRRTHGHRRQGKRHVRGHTGIIAHYLFLAMSCCLSAAAAGENDACAGIDLSGFRNSTPAPDCTLFHPGA